MTSVDTRRTMEKIELKTKASSTCFLSSLRFFKACWWFGHKCEIEVKIFHQISKGLPVSLMEDQNVIFLFTFLGDICY